MMKMRSTGREETIGERCDDVWSVVVTFNPDLHGLELLVRELLRQTAGVIVVDNGSEPSIDAWFEQLGAGVALHSLRINQGIGAAQNIGIKEAKRRGARFVLLSDQDSLPAPSMVLRLREAFMSMSERCDVAGVGPRCRDVRLGEIPFPRAYVCRNEQPASVGPITEVDYLLASGSLLSVAVLERVGLMNEHLFIDYVDVEWAMRARSLGYRLFGISSASMAHVHGDPPIRFMGRNVLVHSPLRHYYHFRNAAWMYKQDYVPSYWKMMDAWGLVRRYVFYSICARPRLQHWRMMTLGLVDGSRSRLGPRKTVDL